MKISEHIRLSLRSKIALTATLGVVFVTALLVYFSHRQMERTADVALDQRGAAIIRGLANECEYGLMVGNRSLLQQAAVKTLAQADVVSAVVFDDHGRVMAAAGKFDVMTKQREGPELVARHSEGEPVEFPDRQNRAVEMFYLSVYLQPSSALSNVETDDPSASGAAAGVQKLGLVELTISYAATNLAVQNARATAVGLAAVCALVVSVLCLAFVRHMVHPLRELVGGTEQLAAGNLAARVAAKTSDELGDLGKAFNKMAGALQQSRDEILDNQRHLEERVVERTADLEKEVAERKRAEEALRQAHGELETRVQERTAQLTAANLALQVEIAERARLESHKTRLAAMLDAAPDFIGFADATDAHILYINKAGREMCGIGELEDVSKLKISDVHPGWVNKMLEEKVLPTAAREGVWRGESAFLHRDGHEIPVSMALLSHKTPAGDVEIFSTISRDITERKQAEETLRHAYDGLEMRVQERTAELAALNVSLRAEVDERARAEEATRKAKEFSDWVVNSLPGVFYLLDETGQFLRWNKNFELVTGYSPEEFARRNALDYFMGEERRLIQERIQQVFTQGTAEAEAQLVAKDGTKTPYYFTGVRIQIDDKPCLIGTGLDITERKQFEEALARLSQQNELILNSAGEGILGLDLEGNVTFVNPAAAGILGYEVGELIGRKSHSTWHHTKPDGSPYPQEECPIYTAFKDGVMHHASDEMFWRKNGTSFHAEFVSTPIREGGKVIGAVATFTDITKRKQAEKNLADANKQLLDISRQAGMAEVATSVLHNVGNVLNSVNVSTTIVSEKVKKLQVPNLAKAVALLREHAHDLAGFLAADPKGSQLPAYLAMLTEHLGKDQATILAELEALTKNVDHIKDIVSMQQSYSRVAGIMETLPVVEVVEDAVRLNAAALDRHGVKIVREYEDVPPVPMQRHKVLQILVNLLRNAKYAMDDGKQPEHRLTLRVGRNGNNTMKVSVIDNGVGIPPENLTRIFEHGFTTRKEGHGFGLHSGALAAKEMGGVLRAHSDGPGKGAAFTLELPLAEENVAR